MACSARHTRNWWQNVLDAMDRWIKVAACVLASAALTACGTGRKVAAMADSTAVAADVTAMAARTSEDEEIRIEEWYIYPEDVGEDVIAAVPRGDSAAIETMVATPRLATPRLAAPRLVARRRMVRRNSSSAGVRSDSSMRATSIVARHAEERAEDSGYGLVRRVRLIMLIAALAVMTFIFLKLKKL